MKYLLIILCVIPIFLYGHFLNAQEKDTRNSKTEKPIWAVHVIIDSASLGYSPRIHRNAEVLQSEKFSTFFLPVSYAGAGLGANYFFFERFGIDLSLLFGKFWMNFSDEKPCITYAGSNVCDKVSDNRSTYANICNILRGQFTKTFFSFRPPPPTAKANALLRLKNAAPHANPVSRETH